MGLRTQRYGPMTTNRLGASHGPGVPRPTLANSHRHARDSARPAAMITSAGQATGSGNVPLRVRIHHGPYTAPAPGTTIVKRTFLRARLTFCAADGSPAGVGPVTRVLR